MSDRLTPEARIVLELATTESRLLNHAYIGPEHILLGMANDRAGRTASVLKSSGVYLDIARRAVAAAVGSSANAPGRPLTLSSQALELMQRARAEAQREGNGNVGAEHMLLALTLQAEDAISRGGGTAQPDDVLNRALHTLRVAPSSLRERLARQIQQPAARDPAVPSPSDGKGPPRPWYARASTWVITAVAGPVAVAVIVAVVLNLAGLSAGPLPSQSPSVQFSSPFRLASGPLKVNVFVAGLNDDLSLVFAEPYDLSASQRALATNTNNIYQLNRSLISSGGSNLDAVVVTISITNTGTAPAEIVGARVIDRTWYPPWNGTLIYLPPQGEDSVSKLGFNLDRVIPVAENVSGGNMEGLFFDTHGIQLPPDTPTTIAVLAATAQHAVSFRIAFDYVAQGKTSTLVVGRGSQPFYVSAPDCSGTRGFPYQRIYSLDMKKGMIVAMGPAELKAEQGADRSAFCGTPARS